MRKVEQPEVRELKTKSCTRRAMSNYDAKFDKVTVRLPKGTKEAIMEKYNMSAIEYIKMLIAKEFPDQA